MSEAGYTLAETLAAMAVIGLTIGSLSFGAQLLGNAQLKVAQGVAGFQANRGLQTHLEALLARGAPFGSQQGDKLTGDAQGFQFACGDATACAAHISVDGNANQLTVTRGDPSRAPWTLPLSGPAHFIYRGSRGISPTWPPADPAAQALAAVVLVQSDPTGDSPVLDAKVWIEEPVVCDFDAVMQACR